VSSPFATPVPAGDLFAPVLMPDAQQIVSYHVVTEGACWGGAIGEPPMRLRTGDVLLIPHGDPYVISSSEGGCLRTPLDERESLEFFRLMAAGELPSVVRDGGGGPDGARLVCGFLGCDLRPYNPVVSALPAVVRVGPSPGPRDDRLQRLVDYALDEAREPSPGSRCTLVRLSELLFVEVVRRCVPDLAGVARGWIAGLHDPVVGRCLELVHRSPAHPWTLAELAGAVGCSRSGLADRFTELIGEPPIHYLTRWRMQLGSSLLEDPSATVEAVARRVGYGSAAAFSRAFTRTVGVNPSRWRSTRR
jgi:AraC-like DNA-binding protein